MDFDQLLKDLADAPLFFLYRLRVALGQLADDPVKIDDARRRLTPGMEIDYFEPKENRLVRATVIEPRRTRVLVENIEDKGRWRIEFAAINLDGVPMPQPSFHGPSDKSAWKVGDQVAFTDRAGQRHYGQIASLNPRTATIFLKDGHKWRVGYALLSPVIEGSATQVVEPKLLEASYRVVESE